MTDRRADEIRKQIRTDILDYVEETSGVCLSLAASESYNFVRYNNDAEVWEYVGVDSADSLNRVISKTESDRDGVVKTFESNPVEVIPVQDAGLYAHDDGIWALAREQDAFSDRVRCRWCGDSTRIATICVYNTTEEKPYSHLPYKRTEDGEVPLCEGCAARWEDAGCLNETTPIATVSDVEA